MAAQAVLPECHGPKPLAVERFYRPELDCLRFLAFFAVFVCHTLNGNQAYWTAHHVPYAAFFAHAVYCGRFGVDLFFLLSAYLITELLLREKQRFGRLDLRAFYMRRILRIWPLYFFGILIGILLPHLDKRQEFPWTYALAFSLMLGNWIVSLKGVVISAVFPLWSVSFEEQFYLIWPALLSKARVKTLLWACGGMLLLSMVSRLALLGYAVQRTHDEMTIFTNTLTRLDPLAVGIATAIWLRGRSPKLMWWARLFLPLAGFTLWVVAGYYCNLTVPAMLFVYPTVTFGAWLIFMGMIGASVAPSWLRYLGKISYGLYVFHHIAIWLTLRLWGGFVHTLGAFITYWCVALALTVALAALSYKYFESPFLRLKERYALVRSRPV